MSAIQNVERVVSQLGKTTFADIYGKDAEMRLRQEMMYLKALLADPKLRLTECTPESIQDCVSRIAIMGLTLDPALKQAYLVKYGSKCTLIIGYQGEIYYLRKEGVIINAECGTVHKNDKWSYTKTLGEFNYKHTKPRSGSRGEIEGAYAVYHLAGGNIVGDYFLIEEILKRKPAKVGGAFWTMWKPEMCIKTALRMARKGIPLGPEIALLDTIDNEIHDADKKDYIEVERLEEIKLQLKKAEDRVQLGKAYNLLPTYERENKSVMEVFKTRQEQINEAL